MPLTTYPNFDDKNLLFEPDPEYPDNKISTIEKFNTWYENFAVSNLTGGSSSETKKFDYFFRGMTDAKYKLYNSAQREWLSNNMEAWKNDYKYLEFIKDLISVAKTKMLFKNVLAYHQINYDNEADFPILSILQHYGTPTPLMDWTYNLDVALYFATENVNVMTAAETIDGYFSIYIINKKEHENLQNIFAVSRPAFPSLGAFHDGKFNPGSTSSFACYVSDFEKNEPPDATLVSNMPKQQSLQKDQDRPLTTYYNQNIIPQEGLFIFNPSPDKPLESIFSNSTNKRLKMANLNLSPFYCYNIRKDLADYIRRKINKNNINTEFIYPELKSFLRKVKENMFNDFFV